MSANRGYLAGVTPEHVARTAARRAANQTRKTARLNGWQLSAELRLSEIRRLARLRLGTATPLGPESSWIECIANALRVRHGAVTVEMISAEAAGLRIGPFSADLLADAIEPVARTVWGRYKLYSPKLAGDKLQLTAGERERAGITRIAAIDESARERRRRHDKERKARQRAAEAALAGPKIKKAELARQLGISRPTLNAWIKQGRVNPETGEIAEFTFPVRRSLLLRNDQRTKNVK